MRGELPPRTARVGHRVERHLQIRELAAGAHHGSAGSAGLRLLEEVHAVVVLAAEGHEEGPGLQLPGVGGDGVEQEVRVVVPEPAPGR